MLVSGSTFIKPSLNACLHSPVESAQSSSRDGPVPNPGAGVKANRFPLPSGVVCRWGRLGQRMVKAGGIAVRWIAEAAAALRHFPQCHRLLIDGAVGSAGRHPALEKVPSGAYAKVGEARLALHDLSTPMSNRQLRFCRQSDSFIGRFKDLIVAKDPYGISLEEWKDAGRERTARTD